MSFVHGVIVNNVDNPNVPVQNLPTNRIALVGIAPIGPVNELTVVSTPRQAVQTFGREVPGFTIPYALASIFKQTGVQVAVVNVFDKDTMTTAVADETVTITAGVGQLANAPVGDAPVVTATGGSPIYTEGTDYTLSPFGEIRVISSATIPDGDIAVSYTHLNPTTITDTVITGQTTPSRTGLELLDETQTELGYTPNILVAPEYCESDAVALKMAEKAELFDATYLIDAPSDKTVTEAIAGRGPAGGVPGFNTNESLLYPLYGRVKTYDDRENLISRPLSPFVAGVIAKTDQDLGYWFSPSNKNIRGIVGTEPAFSSNTSDPASDLNRLNEVGIASVLNNFGSGFRLWGNRNGSAPNNPEADVFVSVRRTRAVISAAIQRSMIEYVDRPITQALIDAIRENINTYLRSLVAAGALIDGVCTYNPADNPVQDIAQGKLKFDVAIQPPSPLERLTFQTYLDPNLINFN